MLEPVLLFYVGSEYLVAGGFDCSFPVNVTRRCIQSLHKRYAKRGS